MQRCLQDLYLPLARVTCVSGVARDSHCVDKNLLLSFNFPLLGCQRQGAVVRSQRMSHEQTRGGTLRTDSAQHVTPLRQRNHRVHGSRTSCVLMCNCCSRLRRKLSIRARSSSLAVCCGGKHDIPHRNNGRLRPTAHTTDAKHMRVTSRQLVAPSSPLGCASPEFDPNCFQRRAACWRRAAPCRCRRTRASSAASLQPLPGSPDRPRRGKTTATTSPPPPPSHHSTHRILDTSQGGRFRVATHAPSAYSPAPHSGAAPPRSSWCTGRPCPAWTRWCP